VKVVSFFFGGWYHFAPVAKPFSAGLKRYYLPV